MKLVINTAFGGFMLTDETAKELGIPKYGDEPEARTNSNLIARLESGDTDCYDKHSRLKVVYIPDSSTDWVIIERDGWEEVLYVFEGKIRSTSEHFYKVP